MARTIGEIYNEMSAEKDALSQVSNLSPSGSTFSGLMADIKNNSKVAIWRLWLYVVAVGHWTNEKLFDRHKNEVQELLNKSRKGRESWIIAWALKYIDGESITVMDGVPQYPANASGPQPVKYASVRDTGDVVYLYIANEDSSGNRVPVSSSVLTRFQEFTKQFRLPGTRYNVVSLDGDTLKLELDIYYEGLLNESTVQQAVIDAINSHLATLPSKGALDGVLYLIDLTDAIQKVEGVRDIVYKLVTGNGTPIDRKYVTEAGYINLDENNSVFNMKKSL